MAIVGSAEVVIRAVGDKLEGDIQRALNNAAAKARPAGRKAGQEYGKGIGEGIEAEAPTFEKKIQTSISGAMDRASIEGGKSISKNLTASVGNSNVGARVGEKVGRDIGNNVARGMGRSNMRRGFLASILKLGLLIPVIGILGGGISALVSGLFAMSGVLTLAASASAALGGALVAVGAAAVAGMVGFKGVGEAIRNGMDPARAEQFAESMKKIAPAARPFVKDFVKLKDEFKAIRNSAAEGLFNGLGNALKRVTPLLPKMTDEFNVLGQAAGDAVESIVRKFTAGDFRRNMGEIVASVPLVMDDLSKAFGNVGQTFASVFAAAAPLTERFAQSIRKSTKGLRDQAQAGKESGKLQSFFNRAGDAAAQMGRIIKNVVEGLFDIGKVGGKTGQRLFDVFEKATKGLADYTDKKKNVDGLKKAFDGIGDNMIAIGGLAKEVGKAFLRLGANPGIGKTADAIKAIIPNIERALNAGVDLGPKLAVLVGQIADLFTVLQDSGALGAVLDIFIALGKMVTALAKIPGVGTVLKIMAMVFAFRLLAKAGSFIGRSFGANFAAMDRSIGALHRGVVNLKTPMTGVTNLTNRLRQGFLQSNTSMIPFIRNSQYVQRHTLGMGRTMQDTQIKFKNFGNSMPILSNNLDKAANGAHRATGRFGALGKGMAGLARGFRGTGAGSGLASAGLLTAGAAAATSNSKFSGFAATLIGAGIGAQFGVIGAAAGAAIGGVVDFGRAMVGTSQAVKNSAAALGSDVGLGAKKAAFAAQTAELSKLKSVAETSNNPLTQLKNTFSSMAAFKTSLGMTGPIKEGSAAAKLLEKDIAATEAALKKASAQSARAFNLNIADQQRQVKDFLKSVKDVESTSKKNVTFNPFRNFESARAVESLQNLKVSLDGVKRGTQGFTVARSNIINLVKGVGASSGVLDLVKNKIDGVKNVLQGLPPGKDIKLTASDKELLRTLEFTEEEIARIEAHGDVEIGIKSVLDAAGFKEGEKAGGIWDNSLFTALFGAKDDGTGNKVPKDILSAAKQVSGTKAQALIGAIASGDTFGVIDGVKSALKGVDGKKVSATVSAVLGNMSAISKVLQGTDKVSKEKAKALVEAIMAGKGTKAIEEILAGTAKVGEEKKNAKVGVEKDASADSVITQLLNSLIPKSPKIVPIQVQVSGFDKVGFLQAALSTLGRSKVVNVQVNALTGNAKLAIAGLARRAPVIVQVTALTGNAKLAIAGISRRQPVNIQVRALIGPAKTAISGISRKAPVNIKVTALTGNAKLAVAGISRKAPVIVKVTANVSKAKSDISGIKGKSVSIIVTGRGMSSVQQAIDRIHGKTVTVTTIQRTVKAAAAGGLITGPGSGTSDSIPALLSNGEYVIRAAQVKKYRAILDSINSGAGIQRNLAPVLNAANDPGNPIASLGVGSAGGVTRVEGVLSLVDGKAYITGVANEQNDSNTAYRNSLYRVGQNN